MSPHDPDELPSARKWQRLPTPVRLKLAHVIADHLRAWGSANYGELRDHPDFSRWFGTHLGHRGEKRFDRMVRSVRQSQPRKTARRSTSEPGPINQIFQPSQETPMPSAANQLARAGAPSFEQLQATLWRRHEEQETAIARCVNEFGEIVDPGLHKQYSAEQRATTLAIAQLSKQYLDALTTGPVLEALVERLLAAHDPESARQIVMDASKLLQRTTGLNAIRSAT